MMMNSAIYELAKTMARYTVAELKTICTEKPRGAWHLAAALAIKHRDEKTIATALITKCGGAQPKAVTEGQPMCLDCSRPWSPTIQHAVDAQGKTWTTARAQGCPCPAWLKAEVKDDFGF